MRHIKAHNIGFLTEKSNLNKVMEEDLGPRLPEEQKFLVDNARRAVDQIMTNISVGVSKGIINETGAKIYIQEIIKQLQKTTIGDKL